MPFNMLESRGDDDNFLNLLLFDWGTAVAQWLRCCATNQKVAGLIPGDVIGIFH